MSNRRNAVATVTVLNPKWSSERVLAEARRRTKELFNPKGTQKMLDGLLKEAGWSSDEFIDALCQDVIRKGSQQH